MYDPEIKTTNIMLCAKYGYRFLPMQHIAHSVKERNAVKRMKKYIVNPGKLNVSRIIKTNTLSELKNNLYGKHTV